ncbi:hypothetical protein [Salinisphaera aquimarina]|uniref:Uncharacterized protein n=1 Tax=Salinisphaera aquimarina TaxID=2094031 RepID=A0ABV7EM23_9GAMM
MSKRKPKKPHRRITQGPQCSVSESAKELDRSIEALLADLTPISAMDAYLALLIGELWLPNISAQIRQALAMSVFVSGKASTFADRGLHESSYAGTPALSQSQSAGICRDNRRKFP